MMRQRLMILLSVCITGIIPIHAHSREPVKLIFDTDIGNDVDDALAVGVIHALQSRGECELLAVTITKDEKLCAPFVDALNTFYGRGEIPIGVVRNGPTPEPSKFTVLAEKRDDGKRPRQKARPTVRPGSAPPLVRPRVVHIYTVGLSCCKAWGGEDLQEKFPGRSRCRSLLVSVGMPSVRTKRSRRSLAR